MENIAVKERTMEAAMVMDLQIRQSMGFFLLQDVVVGLFIKHKPFISEECQHLSFRTGNKYQVPNMLGWHKH